MNQNSSFFVFDELIKRLHLYCKEDRLNPFYKNLALWLVITLMMIMLYNLFNQQHVADTTISYTEFLSLVEDSRIADVVMQGQELYVTDTNRGRFKVYAPQDSDLIGILRQKGVAINAKPPAESPSTIYISDSSGFLERQSANFPGKAKPSKAPFLKTV